jgi:transcriptional regulator with XRE-family HTH domain
MKPQTAHLAKVLKTSIHALGLSLREVERRLDLSRGYLTRLFAGEMDLKSDHVVEIADALGVEPEELFRLAFPPSAAEPTPTVQRLREAFGATNQSALTPTAVRLEREIEQIVNRALNERLAKLTQ